MEVELGLKLTKSLDQFSSADLRIAKGYRREQIKIEINEDGSRIVISGERAVQEMMMMMVGWKMCKKEIEMRGFRKAFKIPNGVILDKIKARLDEDESMLIIFMAKAIKGIRGDAIEEVKDAGGNSESLQVETDEKIVSGREVSAESEAKDEQIDKEVEEDEEEEGVKGVDGNVAEQKEEPTRISAEKTRECEASKCEQKEKEEAVEEESEEKKHRDQSTQTDAPTKPKKFCSPAIAGSALLVSLIVFVMHLIRTNNKPGNKKH